VGRDKVILVLIGSLDRGGCEMHLLNIFPKLQKKGYRVHVQLLSFPGVLADEMRAAGVNVVEPWIYSKRKWTGSLFFRTIRLVVTSLQFAFNLYRLNPDIVHFYLPASYLIGGPVSFLKLGLVRVVSRRSLNYYMKDHPVRRRLESVLHRKMDAILGNSKAVVAQLIEEEGAPQKNVYLIYNGVQAGEGAANKVGQGKEALVKAHDELVITVVANLIPYKGHSDLLEALAVVVARQGNIRWRVVFAGRDDGLGERLTCHARKLGIEERVDLIGACENVPALLAETDIFVLPSHEEGFSNALLEAMAAGIAIIATDVGGNAEALNGGEAGIVVPAKNINALSASLSLLLGDEVKRRHFAGVAKERAKVHFTIEKCLNEYDDLYNSLLSNSR
tara:strand:+ start:3012 stop:4181 length:1170 start_codon:yes stop_codon:yes gene_type:complete